MIRLDDKGIAEAVDRVYPSGTGTYQVNPADRAIAKAQLKRVFEVIDSVYNEPDENLRLALAYLHQALSEEIKG